MVAPEDNDCIILVRAALQRVQQTPDIHVRISTGG